MRKPALIEIIPFVAGAALLASFFQLRAEQEGQREAAVQAFLAANSQVSVHASAGASAADPWPGGTPDQSLWSEERVHAYAESLAAGGEEPLGVLEIGRLGITVPVYDGADEHNLNRGVARVRGTARIEADGNLGIAGHRDGFFRGLKDIQQGDVIELRTAGSLVEYRVTSTQIVDPDNVGVLAPTEERTLTLVTCFPFYFVGHAPQRFIVTAVARKVLPT